MSRWSRRSQEDKERIAKEQQEILYKKEHAGEIAKEEENKWTLNIYNSGYIPIRCPKCFRWMPSDTYTVIEETHPMLGDKKISMITGRCIDCNVEMKRMFPIGLSDDGLLFLMAYQKLFSKGKLKDLRPIKPKEITGVK